MSPADPALPATVAPALLVDDFGNSLAIWASSSLAFLMDFSSSEVMAGSFVLGEREHQHIGYLHEVLFLHFADCNPSFAAVIHQSHTEFMIVLGQVLQHVRNHHCFGGHLLAGNLVKKMREVLWTQGTFWMIDRLLITVMI